MTAGSADPVQVIPAIDLEAGRSRVVYWPGAGGRHRRPDRPPGADRGAVRGDGRAAHPPRRLRWRPCRRSGQPRRDRRDRRTASPSRSSWPAAWTRPTAIRLAFAAGATRVVPVHRDRRSPGRPPRVPGGRRRLAGGRPGPAAGAAGRVPLAPAGAADRRRASSASSSAPASRRFVLTHGGADAGPRHACAISFGRTMPSSWWPEGSATSTASAACATPESPASSSARPSSPARSTSRSPGGRRMIHADHRADRAWPSKGKRRRGHRDAGRTPSTDGPSHAGPVRSAASPAHPGRPCSSSGPSSWWSSPRGPRLVPATWRRGSARASASPGAGRGRRGRLPDEPAPALPAGETRTVTLNTPKGAIAIKVEADLSPIAAGNFVALASCGFYDGTPFHRTPPCRTAPRSSSRAATRPAPGTGGPGYTIKDEPVTTPYKRGTVAMARTPAPELGRLAVLHRPRRRGRRRPRVRQHLPDHRQRHVRDGRGRRDLRGLGGRRATRPTRSPSPRPPSPTLAQRPAQGGHAHDQRHHRHRDRRHRGRALRRERPEGGRELRRRSPSKGFYDDVIFHRVIPGFVIQGGDGQYGKKSSLRRPRRDRRPGLQVRGRAGPGRLRARVARDGQRGPEHERQPVLHLPPGPDRQAAEELHAVRPGDARASTSSTRSWRAPRGTAGPARTIAGRDDLGDASTDDAKVKEFTPRPRAKTLGKRPLAR